MVDDRCTAVQDVCHLNGTIAQDCTLLDQRQIWLPDYLEERRQSLLTSTTAFFIPFVILLGANMVLTLAIPFKRAQMACKNCRQALADLTSCFWAGTFMVSYCRTPASSSIARVIGEVCDIAWLLLLPAHTPLFASDA